MTKHFCNCCGVRLTRQNAYRRSGNRHKLRRICIDCFKKQRNDKYESGNKKFTTKVRRGRLEFPSFEAKHEYITLRRLQARFGRGHISCSSNVNKAVYVPRYEEIEHEDGKIILKHYERMICEECGGLVVYKKNNFQICSDCGLIANDRLNIIYTEPTTQENRMSRRYRNSIPIPEVESQGDSSENVRCYDRYYARAYSKRLR